MIPRLLRKYGRLTTLAGQLEAAKACHGMSQSTFNVVQVGGCRERFEARLKELLREIQQAPGAQHIHGELIRRIESRVENCETDGLLEDVAEILALLAEAETLSMA